jgi:integrase
MHSILRKSLQQALKWGMVSRNVCDLVEAPKPVRKAPEMLSVDQVHTFLEKVKGHRYYPIYVLAVYTGMRQSEILGLYKSDIDLGRGERYRSGGLSSTSEARALSSPTSRPRSQSVLSSCRRRPLRS